MKILFKKMTAQEMVDKGIEKYILISISHKSKALLIVVMAIGLAIIGGTVFYISGAKINTIVCYGRCTY